MMWTYRIIQTPFDNLRVEKKYTGEWLSGGWQFVKMFAKGQLTEACDYVDSLVEIIEPVDHFVLYQRSRSL